MVYQYKIPAKTPAPHTQKPSFATEAEQLSGQVRGIDAAMGEERFAKALNKHKSVREYYFRVNPSGVPRGMPGWLELDFLVQATAGWRAFEIDNMEFVHRGQRKGAEMVLKDNLRKKGLANMGIIVREIEHIDEADLQTVEDAQRVARELL
jgi:hypothetical protein